MTYQKLPQKVSRMGNGRLWLWLGVALLLLLVACRPSGENLPQPTTAVSPTSANPTPIIPDTGWQPLQPGLDERQINVLSESHGRVLETVYILRLDPQQWRFDIAYTPGRAQLLTDWQAETNAPVLLNGGYFTPELYATGLIITAGQAQGIGYGSFAGMLTIDREGYPDLRWLSTRPYDHATTNAWAGLQSFPMLVKPGGELGFAAEADSGSRARRTAIAQSRSGHIYFLITPRGHFTLHELSLFLTDSTHELDINIAFNLDGGPSSGLLVRGGTEIPAFSRLPTVITATPR